MNSSAWLESSGDVDDVAEQESETDYYEFTLPIQAGYTANITTVVLAFQSSGTGPDGVALRWSVDGYASNLGTLATGTGTLTATINQVQGPNLTITFRLYGTRAAAGGGTTGTGRINSLAINGTTTPVVNTADLSLTKTVNNDRPDSNQVITYTIVVSNAGPDDATGVTVTDVLPSGLVFSGGQTGPGTFVNNGPNTGGISWQNFSVPAGGSATFTFNANPLASGGTTLVNFAEITASGATDPDSTPNNGNIGEDDGDTESIYIRIRWRVTITCNAQTTPITCPATPVFSDPTVADEGCLPLTVTFNDVTTPNGGSCPQAYSVTRTWTVMDACGRSASCSRTIAVVAPVVLTCPTNTTAAACQTQAAVNQAFTNWLATASGTGGCNGVLTNNNTGAPSFCGGSTTVTFTYTSTCAPLTTTCQATFTVTAAPPPQLTCPNPLIRPVCQTRAQDSIALQNWVTTLSFSGGCNGSINYNGFNGSPPSSCGGTKTLNLTYTSSCAAPLNCSATFTIPPPAPVVLTCPTNTTIPTGQTQMAVNAAFANWLATASGSGGCNGVLTNNNVGAPPATGGSTTVTFTYAQSPPSTPWNGACPFTTQTCQATFTVASAPPVVLTCPTNTTTAACQTQEAVNTAFATWLATAIGSGGCNGVLTNNNIGAPSACGGSTTVTFTYTSTCAPLTSTCSATFTVADAPLVVLNCPADTTVSACLTFAGVNAAFNVWLARASASGGCSGMLNNNNQGIANILCGGSTTVTFTYTSTCPPFTSTCTSTFTVTAAPTVILNCPADLTVAACQNAAQISAAFTSWLAQANASGGCNGMLANNNQGPPPICGGSTSVTFTYTSNCPPLTSNCTRTFTVAAPQPVVLTCPVNTTTAACQTQAAVNTAFATWLATATASGGCNGALTNNNTGAPPACGGSTTVTFTYASSCAPTTTTCQATFTVANATQPVLTCPTAITVSACLTQAQLSTAYANWLASASATGGCGGGTVTNNAPATPLICNPNSNTITVMFTYAGGTCQATPVTCTSTFTVPAYPNFTVPQNGASQVACPSQIVQPVPPVVLDACGKTLAPTGLVIVNNPNPITCEGTRTFTWTFTDCAGHVKTWSHVTTVERQPFGVPANGGSTVACPDQTDAQPTPPVVTSNCGEVLTPVITSTAKPGCEGNRNWNFTYTDCEGNTATWTYIYTVEYLDFTVPASETMTVECPLNASQPVPPVVKDNCGKTLNAIGPAITSTNNASGCEGSRKYAWTYSDCEGNVHTWSKTFNFQYTADFFVYPDGEDFVGCVLYAQPPVPPTIYDNCGQELSVTGPTVTESISGCSGTRTYTYMYSDCGGHSHPWSFTYHANDNEPPVGNCPGGSVINNVDVTNLDCIEDVPCPDDFDFSDKIEELLEAGNIYDVCSGDDLIVELDSWSELWQCSDPDGDGVGTFGRTFYFRISDQCGNEMPSLCGVTYSGVCQPLETFTQGEWGNEGGEPSASTVDSNDIQTINNLLAQGPLMIGGSLRSITLTSAQCVQNLLPGIGNPTILSNCQQVNCNGCNPAGPIGMKNILATNTISLMLNLRFNVLYHGLTMANVRNQGLGCIVIDLNIKFCVEGGPCKLRIFDSFGNAIEYPYTIGGLLDLSNLYLNGGMPLTGYTSPLYAAAIHNSITNVNAYWHNGITPTTCDPSAGVTAPDVAEKALPSGKPNSKDLFSLAPNPAGNEVTFKLAEMPESQEVVFEMYNQLGQLVLRQEFGQVSYVNERIDLTGIGSGLYIVSVKAGEVRHEQKLVVGRQ